MKDKISFRFRSISVTAADGLADNTQPRRWGQRPLVPARRLRHEAARYLATCKILYRYACSSKAKIIAAEKQATIPIGHHLPFPRAYLRLYTRFAIYRGR